MLPFAAAVTSCIAIMLLAAGLSPRARAADARVRALNSRAPGPPKSPSFSRRIITPMVDAAGARFAALLPPAFLRRTERRLVIAGGPLTPPAFYATALAGTAAISVGYVALVVAASDGAPPSLAVMGGVMLALFAAYLPHFWLSNRAKARQATMLRALPDTMDLLTLCVEAGLGLEGALHRVVEKQRGPLSQEIRQTLREVGLGKSRRDALLDLAERTQLDDIRSLVTALIQAEQLGTSAAKVLRAQAQRMRVRRRQRAEQDARRASVRMVFPLVICLMPSLFIFILGPIIVSMFEFLTKS